MTGGADGEPAPGARLRTWAPIAAAGLVVLVAGVAVWVRGDRPGGGAAPPPIVTPGGTPSGPAQHAWLLVGCAPAGPPAWLAVLAADEAGQTAFMLDLPPSALTVVAGYGSTSLGRAMTLGGEPLLASAVSGLLGIAIDHHLVVPDQALQDLFDAAGGLTIGTHLGGRQLVAYVAGPAAGAGNELAGGARRLQVWTALLARFHPQDAAAVFGVLVAGLQGVSTDATPDQARGFFTWLANGAASFAELPVAGAPAAGAQGYQPDAAAVQAVVGQHLAGSRLTGERLLGRKVEILNGTTNPAAGPAAALRLTPHGFPVVRQAPADRSDYVSTRIVVYSGSEAASRAAEQIRATLGVGEVSVSQRTQGVVDVTVILGGDFEAGGT